MKPVSSDFNNAFTQSEIHMSHKLIVEFGSNRFNDGQVVTASSVKLVNVGIDSIFSDKDTFWKASDVFNNKNYNTMKWLVCDAGALITEDADGSGYRCIHIDEGDYERGWWSDNKSNGSGVFASPEWVKSEFFEPDNITPFIRRCNKIVLYLTEGYPNMKEVTVQYKNSLGTWVNVATNYTLGANEYSVTWNFDPDVLITGLRAYVNKTQNPNDWARLNELNAFWVEDISQYVVGVDTNITREEYEQTVPVGTTASNTLSVRLDNTEGLWNQESDTSIYAPYIGADCRVEFYLGVDINQGVGTPSYEYVQMGEFWTDAWENSSSDTIATFAARDFSRFLMDDQLVWGREWQNTNMQTVMRELLLYMGFPLSRITIDPQNLRGFQIVFLHQQAPWQLMGELAFADQGMFGFNYKGDFEYQSYNRLNDTPFDSPVMSMSWDNFIIDGHLATKIYVNDVIVKVAPYNLEHVAKGHIWSPQHDTVLSWSKLASNINSTATTIPVATAARQETPNLTANLWELAGYLFLPILVDSGKVVTYDLGDGAIQYVKVFKVTGGELIKYASRTDSAFNGCERGYLNTTAQAWTAGQYIGEADYFTAQWDNSPALTVQWPFVTAIDELPLEEGEGISQGYIIYFEHDAFEGKLVIGNVAEYFTHLQGSGLSMNDYDAVKLETLTGKGVIPQKRDWATSVAGFVATPNAANQVVTALTDPEATNKDYIRRYGKNKLTIDNKWIQTRAHAQDIANIIISEYQIPRALVDLNIIANPALETPDRIRITDFPQLSVANRDYHIIQMNFSYDGTLSTSITVREVKP